MITYQDFEKAVEKRRVPQFVRELIMDHRSSQLVKTAFDADAYDRQQNLTISTFLQTMYALDGRKIVNPVASNLQIASNFFNVLNNQRTNYSLGNGVTFTNEGIKERLGQDFDTVLKKAARYSLIHGVSFIFFNNDHCHCFKLTEFAPLYDESTGVLRAGVRYYQIDYTKPLTAVLYEEDGYTVYRTDKGSTLKEYAPKRGYVEIIRTVPANDESEVIGEENYGALPIVPLWGSDLKQSTLVGMRQAIDSYDLIRSGFANDLRDCAQVYWIISGAMGMSDKRLMQFRDRLLLDHIALADEDNSTVTPYTQDIPYQARTEFLNQIRQQIYDDFGALNVSDFSSGTKTATEIQASYQPLDDRADDFEYQIIQAVQQILKLIGIEDTPIFKRNRMTNELEQVQLVMLEADYLDEETILKKLPNITSDEVEQILLKKSREEASRAYFENIDVSNVGDENEDADNEDNSNINENSLENET